MAVWVPESCQTHDQRATAIIGTDGSRTEAGVVTGVDQLSGGVGADHFVVTQFADTTLGFLDRASGWDNRDRIDLLALDRLIKGDLRLVDEDDVTGALGDVLVEQGFDVTQMFVLADAKPGIDLAVRADAIHNLTAGGLMLQARFAHLGGHRAGRGARA